jgi:hypothetical protein
MGKFHGEARLLDAAAKIWSLDLTSEDCAAIPAAFALSSPSSSGRGRPQRRSRLLPPHRRPRRWPRRRVRCTCGYAGDGACKPGRYELTVGYLAPPPMVNARADVCRIADTATIDFTVGS